MKLFNTLLVLLAFLSTGNPAWAGATPSKPSTVLTLLGTAGGPGGYPGRAGIASLVQVGQRHYLIDAGEGVAHQLAQANVSETDIRVVFLTHLHDDHTAGLPPLMSFFQTLRGAQLEIVGPPRTGRLVEGIESYLEPNLEIRTAEQKRGISLDIFRTREVGAGLVYNDEAVKVTAIENTHFNLGDHPVANRNKSYSYRFETPDKVIVFTGDTGPSESVADLARGADILVAEMVSQRDTAKVPPDILKHMLMEHLSPAEVGHLAANAKVKTLILSHVRDVSEDDVHEIRHSFTGKVVIGHDLMRFE